MVRFGLLSSSSNELEFLECSPFPSQPGFGGSVTLSCPFLLETDELDSARLEGKAAGV